MAKVQTIGDLSQRYLRANPILRHLSGIGGVAFFGYSPRHRCLLWWTDNLPTILETSQQQLMRNANLFLRHTHEDDRFKILSELEKSFNGTQDYRVSYRWIAPSSNKTLWLHCRGSLRQKSTHPVFEGFILDMHDEHAALTLSDKSIASSAAILNSLTSSSILLDADFRVEHYVVHNDLLRLFHDSSSTASSKLEDGKLLIDCVKDKDFKGIVESMLAIVSEQQLHTVESIESLKIEISPVNSEQAPSAYLILLSDISKEQETLDQLDELQKSETSRNITTSVLHNVSNTLQSMVGELQTLNQHHTDSVLVKRLSETMLKRVVRLSNLSTQARSLQDESSPAAREADLNLCLLVALQQSQRSRAPHVQVKMNFGDPAPIYIKQSKLVLALRTILTVLNDRLPLVQLDISSRLEEGQSVVELVAAISSEVSIIRDSLKILEHSDLRESVSFIESSNGSIKQESRSDESLAITISFAASGAVEEHQAQTREVHSPEVMIVDDDPLVLECISAMCTDIGYPCVTAQNGLDALRLIHAHEKTLRLAFVDGLLPGMNGATIVRKLKAINPKLVIVGISGAAADVCSEMERAGATHVLSKPVSLEMLKAELDGLQSKKAVG